MKMEIKNEGIVTPFETREGGEEKTIEKIARTIEGLPGVEPAPVTVADVRYLLGRLQEVEDYSLRNYKSYQAEVDAGYRQSRRIAELEAENLELRKLIDSQSGLFIPSNAPKTARDRITQLEGEIADRDAENESLRQAVATMQGLAGQPVPTPATITVTAAAQMEESEEL